MRQRTPVFRSGITAAAALAVLSGPTPAAAQGFLETLFGVFAPKPQIQTPSRDGSLHLGNPFDSRRRRLSYSGGGSYKTVCVRLCDGFYFPISSFHVWIAAGASILPLTLGMDAMRQLVFESGSALGFLSVQTEIWILAGLSVVFVYLAKYTLNYMERLAIREGRITENRR